MTPFDAVRAQLDSGVPFAKHAGVTLMMLEDGHAIAELPQTDASINHIQTQHAGAMFTLGEAASGAALAGAFLPVLMSVRPVAAGARIAYERIARGTITAEARTSEPGEALRAKLEADGKAVFDVDVTLRDEADRTVATMTVAWHVSPLRK